MSGRLHSASENYAQNDNITKSLWDMLEMPFLIMLVLLLGLVLSERWWKPWFYPDGSGDAGWLQMDYPKAAHSSFLFSFS